MLMSKSSIILLLGLILTSAFPIHKNEEKLENKILKSLDHHIEPCKDLYAFTCNNIATPGGPINSTMARIDLDVQNKLIQLLLKIGKDNSSSIPNSVRKASTYFAGCINSGYSDRNSNITIRKRSLSSLMVKSKPIYYEEYLPSELFGCLNEVNKAMPYAVDYIYNIYGNLAPDLTKTKELTELIKAAFIDNIKALQWPDKKLKKDIIKKLKMMKLYNGYPQWIKKSELLDEYYSLLEITGNYNIDIIRSNTFREKHPSLPKEADWPELPVSTEINAEYDDILNAIHLPSAIQAYPFYDPSRPAYFNFATMGQIIAHEMTHALDSPEKEDRYITWPRESITQYDLRADCLMNLYRKFDSEGQPMNPKMTLKEDIADNGAINHVYRAYRNYMKNNSDMLVPGYTPEQLLFIAYSYVWCDTDPNHYYGQYHSPSRARINIPLSNFDKFRQTFHCQSNDTLVSPHKCAIW